MTTPTFNYVENSVLEDKIRLLEEELNEYEEKNKLIEALCSKEYKPIMDKCIKKAIKEIKALGNKDRGLNLLPDDYHYLNFFEQICVTYYDGDQMIYPGLINYIEGVCESVSKELTPIETFILNTYYESPDNDEPIVEAIYDNLSDYFSHYTNAKIRKAIDR